MGNSPPLRSGGTIPGDRDFTNVAHSNSAASQLSDTIAGHRLFPAAAAGWFAALFGIGTLVLPIGLFESIVQGLGISALFPAAAPPLGATALTLIALLAAAAGAALGLFAARKVRSQFAAPDINPAAHRPQPDAPIAYPTAKKPISAHDELGSDGFDDLLDRPAFLSREDEPAQAAPEMDSSLLSSFPELDDEAGEESKGWNAADDAFALDPTDQVAVAPEEEEEAHEFAATAGAPASETEPQPGLAERAMEEQAQRPGPDAALTDLTLAQLIERFSRVLQDHTSAASSQSTDEAQQIEAQPQADARPSLSIGVGNLLNDGLGDEPDEQVEAELLEAGYSSLLTMKRPMGDMDKAHAPEKPQAITGDLGEEALRDALEKLQTLSKSA